MGLAFWSRAQEDPGWTALIDSLAARMPVEQLALIPFSFPTYANTLGRAAILAAIDLDPTGSWAVDHLETAVEAGVA